MIIYRILIYIFFLISCRWRMHLINLILRKVLKIYVTAFNFMFMFFWCCFLKTKYRWLFFFMFFNIFRFLITLFIFRWLILNYNIHTFDIFPIIFMNRFILEIEKVKIFFLSFYFLTIFFIFFIITLKYFLPFSKWFIRLIFIRWIFTKEVF